MLRLFSVHLEAFTLKKEVVVELFSHSELFDEMSHLHKLIANASCLKSEGQECLVFEIFTI